jgi:hypothetical protein
VSSLHSLREVETVQRLIAEGWNDCQISRASGINRRTILDWRHGRVPRSTTDPTGPLGQRPGTCPRCDGTPLDEAAYAYLLGLYLGDGYIDRMPRTYRMRIFQDKRYVLLIELARQAISRVRGTPLSKVSIVPQTGCVAVVAYWNHWPCVFPQHGPGRKHLRRIELEPWQNDVVAAYPRQLLRGLIHSDGCRVMNRVQKRQYVYARYMFTNTSTDILQIFRDVCDAVGVVSHRQMNRKTISVARREDVARMDAFIGPKS